MSSPPVVAVVLAFGCLVSAVSAEPAGLVGLGDLPGGRVWSEAQAVSGDGKVVVGRGMSAGGFAAFRWTAATGLRPLAPRAGDAEVSGAADVARDGNLIVGTGTPGMGKGIRAFRHSPLGGVEWIGDLTLKVSGVAHAVSRDGKVVVGEMRPMGGDPEAFRWTREGGMKGLGDLPGGQARSEARGVSADGAVVVGSAFSNWGEQAFRWTAAGGLVELEDLAGGRRESGASGVTADGSVVVGSGTTKAGRAAFVWTQAGGIASLWDALKAAGVDPKADGWTELSEAIDVSDDGVVIVGVGVRKGEKEAFRAALPRR